MYNTKPISLKKKKKQHLLHYVSTIGLVIALLRCLGAVKNWQPRIEYLSWLSTYIFMWNRKLAASTHSINSQIIFLKTHCISESSWLKNREYLNQLPSTNSQGHFATSNQIAIIPSYKFTMINDNCCLTACPQYSNLKLY